MTKKKKQRVSESKGIHVPRTTPQRIEKARTIKAERAAKRNSRGRVNGGK